MVPGERRHAHVALILVEAGEAVAAAVAVAVTTAIARRRGEEARPDAAVLRGRADFASILVGRDRRVGCRRGAGQPPVRADGRARRSDRRRVVAIGRHAAAGIRVAGAIAAAAGTPHPAAMRVLGHAGRFDGHRRRRPAAAGGEDREQPSQRNESAHPAQRLLRARARPLPAHHAHHDLSRVFPR